MKRGGRAQAAIVTFLMVALSAGSSVGQATTALADLPPTSSAFDPTQPVPAPQLAQSLSSPIPCTGGETVLLIQDNVPWFAPANQDPLGANVTELKAQGINFCMTSSDQLGATNLSRFRAVIIASAQRQSFYDNLFPAGAIHPAISEYVQRGGILSASLADCASGPGGGGTWATVPCQSDVGSSFAFVGGVKHVTSFVQDNDIVANHPVLADGLTCPSGNCGQIVDLANFQDLDGWNFASHGYFANLPVGSKVLLTEPDVTGDGVPEPVMVEYRFGAGKVIASLTTTEWRYAGGFDNALPQNKKLLANDIAYQVAPTTKPPTPGGSAVSDGFDYPISSVFRPTRTLGDSDGWFAINFFGNELDVPPCTARFHPGDDWNRDDGNDAGETVRAVSNGTVVALRQLRNREGTNLGQGIAISHQLPAGGTVFSVYVHVRALSGIAVGKVVARGTPIATIAGLRTFSPHLHFEIRTSFNTRDWYPGDDGCGYYASLAAILANGFVDPVAFIDDHRPA